MKTRITMLAGLVLTTVACTPPPEEEPSLVQQLGKATSYIVLCKRHASPQGGPSADVYEDMLQRLAERAYIQEPDYTDDLFLEGIMAGHREMRASAKELTPEPSDEILPVLFTPESCRESLEQAEQLLENHRVQ